MKFASVKIRKANKNDIPQLIKLHLSIADYHHKIAAYYKSGRQMRKVSSEFVRRQFKKHNFMFLVIEINKKMVGFFSADVRRSVSRIPEQTGYVNTAFIEPKYRGKGLSKLAFNELQKWFHKKGANVVELRVDSRNPLGLRAWKGLGFKEYMKTMRTHL